MTWTRAEIARDVLEDLGVHGSGEAASAADIAAVERHVQAVHDELAGKGLTTNGTNTWTTERIPDYAAASYVAIVAHRVCRRFGSDAADIQLREAAAREAERELRRQTAVPYNPDADMTSLEDTDATWGDIG